MAENQNEKMNGTEAPKGEVQSKKAAAPQQKKANNPQYRRRQPKKAKTEGKPASQILAENAAQDGLRATQKSAAKNAPKNTVKNAAAKPEKKGEKPQQRAVSAPRRRGMRMPLPGAAGQPVTTFARGEEMGRQKPASTHPNDKKLRIIPLGGLNEIGKNMTAVEYGEDIIVVDAGMTFPDDELLGVDLVIPDITYLVQNRDKVRGIVLTHAHEDHIGALPYVLRELNVPIYCTALTEGIISLRIAEHKNLKKVRINRKKAGDKFRLGVFEILLVRMNHSVADAVAVAIKSPLGTVIFTGDFKIDTTPVAGEMADLETFGRLGREGVLLLCQDSTNAERPGFASSERNVGASFDQQFKGSDDKRIIIATFASNVHRIQQIIDIAAKYDRKVAVSGRSMENIMKVGVELGYIKLPDGILIELADLRKYQKNKTAIITTGSQGEPMSALYRMAFSGHRQVEVGQGDKILIAAQPIPGNEKTVYQMINELFKRGAEVVYERIADIHVSGHACQEELKMILALTKPKYFMPMHGEYRHLRVHAGLARQCGVEEKNIFISEVGRVLEIGPKSAQLSGTVPSGRVLIDGSGVGDVGTAVLRERKHLSQDGLISVTVVAERKTGRLLAGPVIESRGFIFVKESEDIMAGMKSVATQAIANCAARGATERSVMRTELENKLSDYLYKQMKRDPMVVTTLIEI